MKTLPLLILLFGLGCRSKTAVEGPERGEAALIFENGLAYDGCAERIQLLSDSLFYGPTPASLPVLQKALTDIPPTQNGHSRAVTIRFIKTGNQTIIPCGWGGKLQAEEVDVLEITKR